MKRYLNTSASIAIMATFLATGAQASDLFGGSAKDAPSDVVSYKAPTNFTGFYIGGRGGYGHANHDLTVEGYQNEVPEVVCDDAPVALAASKGNGGNGGNGNGGDKGPIVELPEIPAPCVESDGVAASSIELFNLNGLDSSGFIGGGQVGFDVQRGRFVGGVFASYDYSNAETTFSSAAFGVPEFSVIEQGDSWSLGARAGVLVNPRTLLYVLAAYTQTEFTFAGLGAGGTDKEVTFDGVTAGAGVEFALTDNVFMGIEGTHTFYGEETLADSCDGVEDCGGGLRIKDDIGETRIMGTLKIKLNSGLLGN